MWAMVAKEFRQLRRDGRTLAMMIILPVLLLVVFGYAASYNVAHIPTVVFGPHSAEVAAKLRAPFSVVEIAPRAGLSVAKNRLRDGQAIVAIVSTDGQTTVLMDGSQLLAAQTAEATLARMARSEAGLANVAQLDVLYNPSLNTSWVMVPGLAGLILVFIGTLITSLGVVRERQNGTLEMLAVMPLRSWDVIVGKIAPYLFVATIDLLGTIGVGLWLFHVPFVGNVGTFALGASLFLIVTLGLGVLISTVSQNQAQAIQLAFIVMLPQALLSGLIFPLSSMEIGVRWISYVLPLTYFVEISRAVMLKGTAISALWGPIGLLALLAVVVMGLAIWRFRGDLAPSGRTQHVGSFEGASA